MDIENMLEWVDQAKCLARMSMDGLPSFFYGLYKPVISLSIIDDFTHSEINVFALMTKRFPHHLQSMHQENHKLNHVTQTSFHLLRVET